VWTGNEMIIWGGDYYDGSDHFLNTGGRYNPDTDSWTPTRIINAPTARADQTAVWTGSEMIVWGGIDDLPPTGLSHIGGRYNPSTDSWTATSTINAPSDRYVHTAVWTGGEMIVWGGTDFLNVFNTGGRYNPTTNTWAPTRIINAPTARLLHTAVWTGSEMIVWGGTGRGGFRNTGGRYSPGTNSWTVTSTINAPSARQSHTAVWAGSQMVVWGGNDGPSFFNTGARYCAQLASPTPTVTTNPATNVASFSATLNGSLNPHGLTTIFHFQYGTTTSYGLTTAPHTQTGNTFRNVNANISSLTASTTCHFRIVASNSAGTRFGSDRTFTTLSATGSPVVTTNPATNLTSSSARLNGSLDPHGLTTTVHFQYGTTTSYGHTTAMQTQTGNTFRNISANISGLTTDTTYHFRIVGINSAGTRVGGDRTFTTP
jgi:hypothetical protein